ncbi:MAG: c-type cytochrome [Bacteroidales bacterium]
MRMLELTGLLRKSYRLGLAFVFCFILGNVYADEGEALFKANCAACHNIDGTPLMGPNLKNVTQVRQKAWLKKFITNSRKMYEEGDPEARAIIDKYNGSNMPPFSFTDQQLEMLINYLSGGASDDKQVGISDTIDKKKSSEDMVKLQEDRYAIHKGFNLFTGKIPFINRGSACISCHNVSYERFDRGGSMARDLTHVFSRMNRNEEALRNVIRLMPFPAMAEAYKHYPLTQEEIEYLIIFLKHADSGSSETSLSSMLLLAGVAGLGILMIGLSILYKRGKTRSVNYQIHERQRKKGE